MLAILKNKNLLINVSWIALVILFIFGGLGDVTVAITFIGVLLSYALIYFLYLSRGKILLPKGLFSYTIFLVLFLISLIWSKVQTTSLIYFFMFLAGGLFWIFFFNFKGKTFLKMPYFDSMVVFLGLVFGIITIYNFITKSTEINASGLINYTVESTNHHHIGDFWVAIVGPLVYALTKKVKRPYLLYSLITISMYFLIVSYSRSAYVALIAGFLYLIFSIDLKGKKKVITYTFLAIAALLCIWSSLGKGLITNRLFYVSGLLGTLNHPFGIGVGGFGVMLQENPTFLDTFGYSSIADNIFLDFIAGMGVLSISFIYWFYTIAKMFFIRIKLYLSEYDETLSYKLFFLILTVNFMFNHIYAIPVVIWLWFASLGLLQSE